MSELKVKVLEAPIFEGVAQDLVLKSNNVNRIVIANTGPVSIQSNLSYSGTLTGNTGIINIGSGQIYKDASGNVGIGTSTPIYKLHVTNSAAANSNTDIIGMTSNYFTNAKKSLTWFSGTDAVGKISTVYNTISGEVGIDMTFGSLYNLGVGMNDSELMRLTSGGRLGIGTPLPDSLLTVNGVASFAAGSAGFPSIARAGDLDTGIFFPAADTIAFTEGGVESMRIDSSGNLGLGVTPSAWQSGILAIDTGSIGSFFAGSTSTNLATNAFLATGGWTYKTTNFATRYATTTTGQHQWFNAPSGTAGNAISFTQVMTLDASGNLSVGTTSTSGKLHISSGATTNPTNIFSQGYLSNGAVDTRCATIRNTFDSNTAFGTYWTAFRGANGSVYQTRLGVRANDVDTDVMTIDSSGNVGIGTASPSEKLVVYGDRPSVLIDSSEPGGSTYLRFADSGVSRGHIEYRNFNHTMRFRTDGLDRLLIDATGRLALGSVIPTVLMNIGGAAPVFRIHTTTAGINSRSAYLTWTQSTNTETGNVGFRSGGDDVFRISNNVTGGDIGLFTSNAERMRIDSSGRVTKPAQPAFQAHGVAGGTFASGSVHIYPTIRFNIGGHYNAANGRFTAPVAGIYLFGWTHIAGTANDTYRYRLRKNGSNFDDTHLRMDTTATGTEYATNGVYTFPISLIASDYIEIFFQSDGANADYPSTNDTNNNYPLFWGYLLG